MKINPTVLKEDNVQKQIIRWLSYQYPKIKVNGSLNGVNLPIGLAMKAKKMGMSKAYPDLQIMNKNENFTCLYIELKARDIFQKGNNLLLKNEHTKEQADMLKFLQRQGNAATFSIGFENTKRCITDYINNQFENTDNEIRNKYCRIV